MRDRHTEDGMGFAGHAPSREDHLERRQTQKIVALANENDRLRALNEELVGALATIRAMLDPDSSDEWVCLKIDALLARTKGGSDAR